MTNLHSWAAATFACVIAISLTGCGSSSPSSPDSSSPADTATFGEAQWESPTWSGEFGLRDVAVTQQLIATVGFKPNAGDYPPQEVTVSDHKSGRQRWRVDRAALEAKVGATSIMPDELWVGASSRSAVVVSASTADGDALVGLAPEHGEIKWTWRPPKTQGGRAPIFASAVGGSDSDVLAVTTAAKNDVSVPCESRREGFVTTVVDMSTGKALWKKEALCPPGQSASGLLLYDDQVIETSTGKQLWRTDDSGEVLGASGSVILWAPGAESSDNKQAPVLIDVRDSSAKQPKFPSVISQRIHEQHGLLRVPGRAEASEPATLRTYRAGDHETVTTDLGDDPLGSDKIVGVAGDRLVRISESNVDLLTPSGKRLSRWTADGDVMLISSGADYVVLSVDKDGAKQWVLLPINDDGSPH